VKAVTASNIAAATESGACMEEASIAATPAPTP